MEKEKKKKRQEKKKNKKKKMFKIAVTRQSPHLSSTHSSSYCPGTYM